MSVFRVKALSRFSLHTTMAVYLFVCFALASAALQGGGISPDIDGDGVDNTVDNCAFVANPTQIDTNSDGYGNRCDPDLNNDGVVNSLDLALLKSVFFSSDQDADLSGDGVVNAQDLGIIKAFFFGPPGPSGALPVIDVSPSNLAFGGVFVGDEATASFTIANPGFQTLIVDEISAPDPYTVFAPTSFMIEPGAAPRTVQVGFAPGSAQFFPATVSVSSNADLEPVFNLNVNGVGVPVLPDRDINVAGTLEFGAVPEDLFAIRTLTVVNLGTGPLTLSSLASSQPEVSISLVTGSLPVTISGGASRQVAVRFDPPAGSAGSSFSGQVSLGSDDPDEPIVNVGFTAQVVMAIPAVNVPVASARVNNPDDEITAANCGNVGGEIEFSDESLSSDTFRVELIDQQQQLVAGMPVSAPAGAATIPFGGIDACSLADGVIDLRVIVTRDSEDLSPYPGTPAAKNTGSLPAPLLDPVEPATAMLAVEICGTSRASTTVRISGGASVVLTSLDASTTGFCLDVPLRLNQQNTLIVTAVDNLAMAPRPVATAPPVQIIQVNPSDIVIVEVDSDPLTVEEVEELVENGVIDLDDPSNYNVSVFTIVFTVGGSPVTVTAPIAVPVDDNDPIVVGDPWDGDPPDIPDGCTNGCTGIVVLPAPDGSVIPGVIIIDGRVLTLREFFQVTLAVQNSSPTLTLTDVEGQLILPAGLTPIAAGLGLDVGDVNTDGAVDSVAIGEIAPGNTGVGQFIVRGDSIGSYAVNVDFDGFLTGGILPSPLAFAGSAGTSVQVFGPPELGIVVRHPPDVLANEIYDLIVEITNLSPRPALYTSLDLFVGGASQLLDDVGDPLPGSNDVRDFGTIVPGGTVAATFRVRSDSAGDIIACQAIASENISLTVATGTTGDDCDIANTIPASFQPLPVDQPPTLFGISPLNGQGDIPVTTSILATLTPESGCFIADTWTNVVTAPIGGNPANGEEIVSADFVSAGTFYLEELDAFGDPVAHIPTALTFVSPPAGGTTIATLRLGLDSPLSQVFLKSNTTYRATLVGDDAGLPDAVCNASNLMRMLSTFRWSFTTEQNCTNIGPLAATLSAPPDGSVDQPLNQQIVIDFNNRMNLGSLAFDPFNLGNSTIGFYTGAMEVAGDLTGETPLPGTAAFSNLNRTFTFTPQGNLPIDEIVHVRLTDGLQDECGSPLQTPPSGVQLFSFTTEPPDSVAPAPPLVDPLPVLTNASPLLVSGSAEPSSTVEVTGGAATATSSVSAGGLFTVNVPLTPDEFNLLAVTATDASDNTSAPAMMDINGDVLEVEYDATPPTVMIFDPLDGATGISRSEDVMVQFDEDITPGTVNSLNFSLNEPAEAGGDAVPGSLVLVGTDGFAFVPDAQLDYATTYTTTVRANGVRDLAGNGLVSNAVSSFTTLVPPPPLLDTVTPDNATQGDTSVPVTFTGSFLDSADTVISDNGGVTGTVTDATETTVNALIDIGSIATVGTTTLGLATAGGSASLLFTVNQKPPVIDAITPASGQVGTTVTAQITGSGLTDITDIAIDCPGVTLNDLGTGSDTSRDVEFVIAFDAALGPCPVTVTTDAGTSPPADFIVTPIDVTVTWINSLGGDWSNPANWSTGMLPGPADNVQISTLDNAAVTLSTGSVMINNLTGTAPLVLTGGVLEVATFIGLDNTITLSGGTIRNAQILPGAGGEGVIVTSFDATLDGVTLNTDVTVQNGGVVTVLNGLELNGSLSLAAFNTFTDLQFSGTQTLSGSGEVVFVSGLAVLDRVYPSLDDTVLTIGPGITIRSDGGSGTVGSSSGSGRSVINQGTIRAVNGSITTTGDPFVNEGLIEADGGTMTLTGSWSNNGTLRITSGTLTMNDSWINNGTLELLGGTLNLGGTFTLADLGTLTVTGGMASITGTLDNTGTTLSLNAGTGDWALSGGTIIGGTVTSADGAQLIVTSFDATLDGVTLNTDVTVQNGGVVTVLNGLELNGSLSLAAFNTFTDLQFSGTQTLSGSGEVVFVSGLAVLDRVYPSLDDTVLTIGPGITIRSDGGSGTVGSSSGSGRSVINQGTIRAVNGSITTTGDPFVNEGLIEADGGTMTLTGSWSNNGTLRITSGTLTMNDSWINNGTLELLGGTLNLGGTFTLADLGTLTVTGGMASITGTLDNTGTTLSLNAGTGDWALSGGTIIGGTVTSADGAQLIVTSFDATLDGVTLNTDVTVQNGGVVTVLNGLELNGSLSLAAFNTFTDLQFSGTQTLSGSGEVVFVSGLAVLDRVYPSLDDTVLTIGPGITIRSDGGSGTVGSSSGSGRSVINQGTIRAVNGSITTTGDPFVNEGLIEADGGTMTLTGSWSNNGTLRITSGTLTMNDSWINNGTLELLGGTLNLGGTFTLADLGTLTVTGGMASITGTLDNTGTTLSLNAGTGDWALSGGTIIGGTVTSADGAQLIVTSFDATLDGVTLNTDVTVQNGGVVTVLNGLELNGSLSLAAFNTFTDLQFSGTQTLSGSGEVVFVSGLAVLDRVYPSLDDTVLTIGPGITIRSDGGSGTVGSSSGSGRSVINQGTIRAVNGSITTTGDPFVNEGLIEADGGTITAIGLTTMTGTLSSRAGNTLSVSGDLLLTATSTIRSEIAGVIASQIGVLSVTGQIAFDGTLELDVDSGYTPGLDDTFAIIDYGSRSGEFATVTGDDLGGGSTLDPQYGPNQLDVVVVNITALGSSMGNPAKSCLEIDQAGASGANGKYWIQVPSGVFQMNCDFTSDTGGWTRVAGLDTSITFCGNGAVPDLAANPDATMGRISDSDAQALMTQTPGSPNDVLFVVQSDGRYFWHALESITDYDTSVRTTSTSFYCADWQCDDGSTDSTSCGTEGNGCPVTGMGDGGGAKKIYLDSNLSGHQRGLHTNGGVCGLPGYSRAAIWIYVR